MGEETEDSVELQIASKAEAIKFIENNINREAATIEVVKHATGEGYTGTAKGLPS